ncbi:hypothetical protein BC833DRAFT_602737 [Globomyces pollinis-pini]|nr:hypothetical protein BC833DRAFT_602737 [Globomyces pollinis-pini]
MKLYSLFCIVPILASPNGVPVCEINNQISGMGPASELGYTIVPTRKDDEAIFKEFYSMLHHPLMQKLMLGNLQ